MPPPTSAAILTDGFIDSLSVSVNTRKAYRNDVDQYLTWLHKKRLELDQTGQTEVQRYLDFLARTRKPSAVRRAGTSLRLLYTYMGNPIPKGKGQLRFPARSKAFSRSLPRSTVHSVRNVLEGPDARDIRNVAMFDLLYSCGIRVSELVALNVSEVRLKEKLIRPTGKGDITRVIPLGGLAAVSLKQWIQKERSFYLIQNGVPDDSDALFVNRQGTRIARQSVQRILGDAGRAVDPAAQIAPHMVRDTCAQDMLDNGATRTDVDLLFGHVAQVGHARMDRTAIEQLRIVMKAVHPSWQTTS